MRTGVNTGTRVGAGADHGVHSGLGLLDRTRMRMCPCARKWSRGGGGDGPVSNRGRRGTLHLLLDSRSQRPRS